MFGVGCSAFGSSILLQPRFPAAFEHEHVGELRFLAQAMGNFPAGVTTQATAIDDDFFAGRPHRQKLRQQFIPPVFIQRNRAGNVIARELIVRPRINPESQCRPKRVPARPSPFPTAQWRSATKSCRGNRSPRPPPGEAPGLPLRQPGVPLRISMCLTSRSRRTSRRSRTSRSDRSSWCVRNPRSGVKDFL